MIHYPASLSVMFILWGCSEFLLLVLFLEILLVIKLLVLDNMNDFLEWCNCIHPSSLDINDESQKGFGKTLVLLNYQQLVLPRWEIKLRLFSLAFKSLSLVSSLDLSRS